MQLSLQVIARQVFSGIAGQKMILGKSWTWAALGHHFLPCYASKTYRPNHQKPATSATDREQFTSSCGQ
jgi:hypothetical protein